MFFFRLLIATFKTTLGIVGDQSAAYCLVLRSTLGEQHTAIYSNLLRDVGCDGHKGYGKRLNTSMAKFTHTLISSGRLAEKLQVQYFFLK